MDRLRRAMRVPDATTAGVLSRRLCLGRPFLGLTHTFTGGGCTDIHIPRVVWRCAGVHAKLYGWRVVCGSLEDTCVTMRRLENHCLRSVHAVDLTSWRV